MIFKYFSSKKNSSCRFLVVLSIFLLLSSCGIKGPLYFPDDETQGVVKENERY